MRPLRHLTIKIIVKTSNQHDADTPYSTSLEHSAHKVVFGPLENGSIIWRVERFLRGYLDYST